MHGACSEAASPEAEADDPAALSIKGRLLKDRALLARGRGAAAALPAGRRGLCARGRRCGRPTYPLINAATLSLLAGDA